MYDLSDLGDDVHVPNSTAHGYAVVRDGEHIGTVIVGNVMAAQNEGVEDLRAYALKRLNFLVEGHGNDAVRQRLAEGLYV